MDKVWDSASMIEAEAFETRLLIVALVVVAPFIIFQLVFQTYRFLKFAKGRAK